MLFASKGKSSSDITCSTSSPVWNQCMFYSLIFDRWNSLQYVISIQLVWHWYNNHDGTNVLPCKHVSTNCCIIYIAWCKILLPLFSSGVTTGCRRFTTLATRWQHRPASPSSYTVVMTTTACGLKWPNLTGGCCQRF